MPWTESIPSGSSVALLRFDSLRSIRPKMLPRTAHLWALLCFLLALQLATAHDINLLARQDGGDPEVTATGSEPEQDPQPSRTATDETAAETNAESTVAETDGPRTTASERGEDSTTTFTSDEPRSTSELSITTTDNSTFYDSTLELGSL